MYVFISGGMYLYIYISIHGAIFWRYILNIYALLVCLCPKNDKTGLPRGPTFSCGNSFDPGKVYMVKDEKYPLQKISRLIIFENTQM